MTTLATVQRITGKDNAFISTTSGQLFVLIFTFVPTGAAIRIVVLDGATFIITTSYDFAILGTTFIATVF